MWTSLNVDYTKDENYSNNKAEIKHKKKTPRINTVLDFIFVIATYPKTPF